MTTKREICSVFEHVTRDCKKVKKCWIRDGIEETGTIECSLYKWCKKAYDILKGQSHDN
jgi:hypothetical protein